MFVQFFLSSLVLAVALSCVVALLFWKPVRSVLLHLLEEDVAAGWTRYVAFALVVAGVSSGTRVRLLEEYLAAPSWNQSALQGQLTREFWYLEMYRTAIGTVEGMAWVLLGLSLLAGTVHLLVRKNRVNKARIYISQTR